MLALSLLVPLRDPGARLDVLVRALDGQTASASTFETVLVDGGSTDGSSERLVRLAASRPHVTYVPLGREASLHDLVAVGVERAQGELVALVPSDTRPTLDAVELLVAAATEGRSAVGRPLSSGAGDGRPLEDEPVADAVAPAVVAVPASALRSDPDPAAALLEGRLLTEAVAVGTRACLAGTFDPPSTSALDVVSCAWEGRGLDVQATVADAGPDVSAWLVVARADGLRELLLPAEVETDDLAPSTARLRAALPLDALPSDDLWSLRLRVRAGADDHTYPVLCPSPGPAVVDGRLAAALVDPGGLVLDLGATTTGVVGRVPLADATVDRTARGSLLVLRCRHLHVVGEAAVPVSVFLGRFRLRAALVCEDGEARVECWASGLAGRSRIAVQVGGPRPRRTGLDLEIGGTGKMSLVRTRKKRPVEPEPAPPAEPSSRRLRQLRKHLPAAVLPSARRIARTAVGRRVRALVVRL